MYKKFIRNGIIIFLCLVLTGCTLILQKGRRSDIERISELERQLEALGHTKELLEDTLRQEISDKKVRLEMADRGLVITLVAEVLFDSGKAKIKSSAYPILDKVAKVLVENVPDSRVGIEGHTDNEPIRFSRWRSNWELSSHRALSVLHYLVDKKGIEPERVSAIGYGEYQPIASNDTKEGRQLNRRVEIVILPPVSKVKPSSEPAGATGEPLENLK